MNLQEINTIDQVIDVLNQIVNDSKSRNNPLGYFAALYKKVTEKIKEGIATNYFDDGAACKKGNPKRDLKSIIKRDFSR